MMRGSRPAEPRADNVIEPGEAHLTKVMSMGYLTPGDQPLIWRGPMAKAVQQCLLGVNWGELDYLIVDLPPGTGDVHLTLVQTVPVTGGVIVSTPQDVGLQISMKTLRMFQQTKVPILGIVENMSYYVCPHWGARRPLRTRRRRGGGQGAGASVPRRDPARSGDPPRRRRGDAVVIEEPESASGRRWPT